MMRLKESTLREVLRGKDTGRMTGQHKLLVLLIPGMVLSIRALPGLSPILIKSPFRDLMEGTGYF